jgi:putative endonuclease
MSNETRTLYIGYTSSIVRRVLEHKLHQRTGFTDHYCVTKLVYYEVFFTRKEALLREKQLKGWRRCKKIVLIEHMNPGWVDLQYFDQETFSELRGTNGKIPHAVRDGGGAGGLKLGIGMLGKCRDNFNGTKNLTI